MTAKHKAIQELISKSSIEQYCKLVKWQGAPIVLGLILGPIMEEGLVQSYLMGQGYAWPYTSLFINPLSWVLIAMCLFSFLWPYIGLLKGLTKKPGGAVVDNKSKVKGEKP